MNEEIQKLKEKIEDHEKRILELEQTLKNRSDIISNSDRNSIKKIANKLDVSPERFNEIFDIEDEKLTVIRCVGKNDKEKTQNLTLLTLLGYQIYFDRDGIVSQEIRRNVAENGVALNNFGTYLNELSPSLIRRKGKLRSPKTTYRLTVLGKTRAREIIKNILGD